MNSFPSKADVEAIKARYKPGSRVELVSMDDPYTTLKPGDRGFVMRVDDIGTVHIAGRYGGLENLGERLMKSENFKMALDEIVWLLTLMANQSVLIYNLKHKDAPRELLTEEEVELLTSPLELASYKNAITEAMFKGTARNVTSEDDGSKNTTAG